jgi:plasmid stability protein
VAALSIRDLNEGVRDKLRRRAAAHGRSLEAEIRAILTEAVGGPGGPDLLTTVLERFREVGGAELDLPARSTPPRAADLS